MPANSNTKTIEVPVELLNALKKSSVAKNYFDAIPASHKQEYIKWIAEAKKEDTRKSRAAKSIIMMEAKAATKT
ncbi:MAG TPA: YdeI/OmpD-associated family protein [Parafilimonas sp.]|nr:YdeI/OmpD-associated family protein [Parafilimonas sp.]